MGSVLCCDNITDTDRNQHQQRSSQQQQRISPTTSANNNNNNNTNINNVIQRDDIYGSVAGSSSSSRSQQSGSRGVSPRQQSGEESHPMNADGNGSEVDDNNSINNADNSIVSPHSNNKQHARGLSKSSSSNSDLGQSGHRNGNGKGRASMKTSNSGGNNPRAAGGSPVSDRLLAPVSRENSGSTPGNLSNNSLGGRQVSPRFGTNATNAVNNNGSNSNRMLGASRNSGNNVARTNSHHGLQPSAVGASSSSSRGRTPVMLLADLMIGQTKNMNNHQQANNSSNHNSSSNNNLVNSATADGSDPEVDTPVLPPGQQPPPPEVQQQQQQTTTLAQQISGPIVPRLPLSILRRQFQNAQQRFLALNGHLLDHSDSVHLQRMQYQQQLQHSSRRGASGGSFLGGSSMDESAQLPNAARARSPTSQNSNEQKNHNNDDNDDGNADAIPEFEVLDADKSNLPPPPHDAKEATAKFEVLALEEDPEILEELDRLQAAVNAMNKNNHGNNNKSNQQHQIHGAPGNPFLSLHNPQPQEPPPPQQQQFSHFFALQTELASGGNNQQQPHIYPPPRPGNSFVSPRDGMTMAGSTSGGGDALLAGALDNMMVTVPIWMLSASMAAVVLSATASQTSLPAVNNNNNGTTAGISGSGEPHRRDTSPHADPGMP